MVLVAVLHKCTLFSKSLYMFQCEHSFETCGHAMTGKGTPLKTSIFLAYIYPPRETVT